MHLAVLALLGLALAYRFYGRFLAWRLLGVEPARLTPARALEDGVDYVPTRAGVVFGHHFASIAGLGPLLGPAIGAIWGWLPALLWIVLGTIFIGAVHDLSALFLSLRHGGRSVGDVTGDLMGSRARLLFLVLTFFILALAMGVFVIIVANLFGKAGPADTIFYPSAIPPAVGLMLIAVAMGLALRRRPEAFKWITGLGVLGMALALWVGMRWPFLPLGELTWSLLLLGYCFVASVLPVWLLLQPRDFVNAIGLYLSMGLMYLGLFLVHPSVAAPAVNPSPQGAPPAFPFLFITIACGAISGFHSIVASGTTAKQLAREEDALPVAYGGMLVEGALAVAALMACVAGLGGPEAWAARYASWGGMAGLGAKIGAFIEGSSSFVSAAVGLLGVEGEVAARFATTFIATVIVSFALTTLDSATRLLRYNIEEIGRAAGVGFLRNRALSSALAVGAIGFFALLKGPGGKPVGLVLWQLFGTTNQLLAALVLLAASAYLYSLGKRTVFTFVPMVFMLGVTGLALLKNIGSMLAGWRANLPLLVVSAGILGMVLWFVLEAVWWYLLSRRAKSTVPQGLLP